MFAPLPNPHRKYLDLSLPAVMFMTGHCVLFYLYDINIVETWQQQLSACNRPAFIYLIMSYMYVPLMLQPTKETTKLEQRHLIFNIMCNITFVGFTIKFRNVKANPR